MYYLKFDENRRDAFSYSDVTSDKSKNKSSQQTMIIKQIQSTPVHNISSNSDYESIGLCSNCCSNNCNLNNSLSALASYNSNSSVNSRPNKVNLTSPINRIECTCNVRHCSKHSFRTIQNSCSSSFKCAKRSSAIDDQLIQKICSSTMDLYTKSSDDQSSSTSSPELISKLSSSELLTRSSSKSSSKSSFKSSFKSSSKSSSKSSIHRSPINKSSNFIKSLFKSSFSKRCIHLPYNYQSLLVPLLLVLCTVIRISDACSARSTPKPRPPLPEIRPNITFQTYQCPEAYAKWYCLNGATCFFVRIGESILYNCECADGYMGQRCEFKDLEGSYLQSREKVLLETAKVAGGAFTILVLFVFVALIGFQSYRRRKANRRDEWNNELPFIT